MKQEVMGSGVIWTIANHLHLTADR